MTDEGAGAKSELLLVEYRVLMMQIQKSIGNLKLVNSLQGTFNVRVQIRYSLWLFLKRLLSISSQINAFYMIK